MRTNQSFLLTILMVLFIKYKNVSSAESDPGIDLVTNRIESKIIRGQSARDGQFPHLVQIIAFGGILGNQREFSCGGSILSATWVMTAAHCIYIPRSFLESVSYQVNAGSTVAGEARQTKKVRASNVHRHPDFQSITQGFDIALLKTTAFNFTTDFVKPIAVGAQSWTVEWYMRSVFYAAGYGATTNTGPSAKTLLWTTLRVISTADCQKFYNFPLPRTIFCVADPSSSKSSVCLGDSGGPGMIIFNEKFVEIGLVSFVASDGCDTAPQAYTNVNLFIDWTRDTMARN